MAKVKITKITKKDKVYMTHDGILMVNGKAYLGSQTRYKKIDGIEHVDKQLFVEFNKEDFEKKVSFIVDKIRGSVDKEELIKEVIQKKAYKEITSLYKILSGKEKKKISKQNGCLGLKIGTGKHKTGGAYLELVD